MKPLALASGHGRHMAVAPERTLASVEEWPLQTAVVNLQPFKFRNGFATDISLLKPPCGGFRSEIATWIQKCLKKSFGTSRKL
jgi:hypothetical protein